ncbi:HlyD family efflux transporter periplasmic adaptor subunit [Chryseobacterium sp.]|uniref:HlyD family secretion protein n=1 Tax=Chryseobacterium sp. TaxID=1871047 RepID=UPI0025BC95BA|nr:HlyD family efflux transporter periplasmic adaptor subunit [Chryseobacterium sp.]MBV8325757.1 HlyD family efflux transporter periplasmic adaptor subunit [Chryseobacterium sp.]
MKHTIYISILFFIILALALLPIIKVPISSSSRGMIRSVQENTKISAIVSGRIIYSKLEKNNQELKQGDTLLIVTAEQLNTQKNLQNSQSSDYSAQLQDLNKLTKGQISGLQTGQYQRELSAMQEKIAQVQTQLSLAQKDFDRAATLYKQGVVPKAEYEKFFYNLQGLKNQIAGIREQQIAQWQTQKREVERQIRSLGSEVHRINQEQKNYIITAPISGRLVNFSGVQKNNFLTQGQDIGEISPEVSLVAECLVSPKDIGFIHKGQNVKCQIDTYNYNQWGLLEGRVSEIDQNIKINEQTGEVFFRVLCQMNKNYLQLKNGYKGQIDKGMTFTARFHLINRTLWQLLFDRVDDWFNPKLK